MIQAGIAQVVERNLAKVEVDGSNPFSRSSFRNMRQCCMFDSDLGAIAQRLCPGLQIRLDQFDSGSRLQKFIADTVFKRPIGAFFFFCITDRCSSLMSRLRSGLDLAGASFSLPIQCHGGASRSVHRQHGCMPVLVIHCLFGEFNCFRLFWKTVVIEIWHCLSIEKLQEIANGLSLTVD